MTTLEQIIAERNIPVLMQKRSGAPIKTLEEFEQRREQIKTMLQEEEYGYIPPRPDHLDFKVENYNANFAAGKAIKSTVLQHMKHRAYLNISFSKALSKHFAAL